MRVPNNGGHQMRKFLPGSFCAIALILAVPALGQTDSGTEFAFRPRTTSITLLNEGGKYVAVDLKHIPEGWTCRMAKDATLFRVGPNATQGTTRVRYAAPQISSGRCPFLTIFDLPTPDYDAARAAFVQKETQASQRIEQLKKDLGDKMG